MGYADRSARRGCWLAHAAPPSQLSLDAGGGGGGRILIAPATYTFGNDNTLAAYDVRTLAFGVGDRHGLSRLGRRRARRLGVARGEGVARYRGLGVLDRLTPREAVEEEVALRFLVLAPTRDEAERAALELFPYAQAVGLTVTVPGGSWGTSPGEAESTEETNTTAPA